VTGQATNNCGGLNGGSDTDPSAAVPHTNAGSVRPYLSIEQLAAVTPWTVNAIRKLIARGVLQLGVHYFQPFGRRRGLFFKWSAIVAMIEQQPPVMEEPKGAPRQLQPRSVGIDVEQATADFERLLG